MFTGIFFMLFVLVGGALGLAFYFLPTIVAQQSRHPSAMGIFVLNLLLGWSLIGWIIALVWAFSKPQQVVIVQQPYPQPPHMHPPSGQPTGFYSTAPPPAGSAGPVNGTSPQDAEIIHPLRPALRDENRTHPGNPASPIN